MQTWSWRSVFGALPQVNYHLASDHHKADKVLEALAALPHPKLLSPLVSCICFKNKEQSKTKPMAKKEVIQINRMYFIDILPNRILFHTEIFFTQNSFSRRILFHTEFLFTQNSYFIHWRSWDVHLKSHLSDHRQIVLTEYFFSKVACCTYFSQEWWHNKDDF